MGREQLRKSLCVVLLLQFVQEGRSVSDFKGRTELPYQDKLPHIQGRLWYDHSWCDEVLGCLHFNASWRFLRPFSPAPDTRKFVNTMFYLNTRSHRNVGRPFIVTPENILKTSFKASKPTKFIVHGYTEDAHRHWVKEMTSALLSYGDYNVIRVGWKKGANRMYRQSTVNTRVVGLEIGHFVAQVNLDPSLVHCIGFSLGAHVCGYGGERIPRLGRITGLDPAGIYFIGTRNFVHLDPTDADFVDVIHTSRLAGTTQRMGNLDFFPNSGKTQPGCHGCLKCLLKFWKKESWIKAFQKFSCRHSRSVSLFIESLKETSSCSWLAHTCKSYQAFKKGHCLSCGKNGDRCAYMGIRADEYVAKSRKFVRLYLDTDKDAPYCMNHYGVSFVTPDGPGWSTHTVGRLYISIREVGGRTLKRVQITGNHEKIYFGTTIRKVFLSHTRIDNIERIGMEFKYSPAWYKICWGLFCKRNFYVKSVEVSPLSIYSESKRLAYKATYCGGNTKISDGQTKYFDHKSNCRPI